MTYPQQPTQYPYPPQGYPPQGYPQQPGYGQPQQPYYPQPTQQPYYPPQPGYGQNLPVPPPAPEAPPRAPTITGGKLFTAEERDYEKRESISWKNAQVGLSRTLVNDRNPIAIQGTDYVSKLPAVDGRGQPKYTIGTGYIDEHGQKVMLWCGMYSRAAQKMTAARKAVGIGPEDSMIGWVTFIRFIGTVPTGSGDANDFDIMLMPIEQAGQYLTPQQMEACGVAGIAQAKAPGNLECRDEESDNSQQQAAPQIQQPQIQQPQMQQNGHQQAPVYTQQSNYPPAPPQPQQAPPQQPQQQQPGPWGAQQAPGGPAPAPGWPQAGQQPQQAPMGQPQPQPPYSPAQPPYGAPQGDPMAAAVNTVSQYLGGQPVAAQPQQPAEPPDTFMGYPIQALANYANMPDPTIAGMGHNPQQVRYAVSQARAAGVLPNTGAVAQPPQGPPQPGGQFGGDPPF
jgi:hypothetical protein